MKAQIAAKEQAKRQWKEQAKQEERLEEARMKMERQRLRDEFERETEKARRKEVCVCVCVWHPSYYIAVFIMIIRRSLDCDKPFSRKPLIMLQINLRPHTTVVEFVIMLGITQLITGNCHRKATRKLVTGKQMVASKL